MQGCQKTSALLQHTRQNSRLGRMMWTAIQWTQVTAGVGFAVLAEPWRDIPRSRSMDPSLRDFLTDSECTIEIANIYTVRIRRVHDSILMEDAMTGNFTDGETRRSIAADCTFRSNVSQIFAQLQARRQIQDCKHNRQGSSPSMIKRFRQGLPGSARGQCGDSSSNRIRVIPRAIDSADRAMERPDLRKWPAYYDSTSQMLCQLVPLGATTTLDTSSTKWKYHTAGLRQLGDSSP
jgi:hypothetical protein